MDTLQILWIGHNGREWDLTDPFSPVRLVSLQGFGSPGFTKQFSATGARDGRRYEGTQWNHNEGVLTVQVGDDYPAPGYRGRRYGGDWRELDRSWRRSLSVEETGRLVVISEVGRRTLHLSLADPVGAHERNAADIGMATYALSMTADDRPWWEGDPVAPVFDYAEPGQPFLTGGPADTIVYISPNEELLSATLTNPGDRPAYPQWFAQGPFTSVTIGIEDKAITLPFSRAAGQRVFVDSLNQTITDDTGNSLWPLMGFTDPTFAPIPAAEAVDLITTVNGGGAGSAIGVSIIPLYESPW